MERRSPKTRPVLSRLRPIVDICNTLIQISDLIINLIGFIQISKDFCASLAFNPIFVPQVIKIFLRLKCLLHHAGALF